MDVATFDLLGWPDDEIKLSLDHERFAYAGKFVMSNTGKAVARVGSQGADSAIVAAVAFNADRTDPEVLWLRYVTVAHDRRGEQLGPELCLFVIREARERYERARIAVNNPFAYEALYRAGFVFTGRETGIAELVLERPVDAPADQDPARYRVGLDRFRARDLSEPETAFVENRETPPPVIDI